jgi:hypothetical protein
MQGRFTLTFEDPFWVGLFEREDEQGYSAARWVFGAEPRDAELYDLVQQVYPALQFSTPDPEQGLPVQVVGFKRRQREIRRMILDKREGTRAQQAVKADYELYKKEKQVDQRQKKQAEAEEKFLRNQIKRKEKHKGH